MKSRLITGMSALIFFTTASCNSTSSKKAEILESGSSSQKNCVINFQSTEGDIIRLEYNPNFFAGGTFEVESLKITAANRYGIDQKVKVAIDGVRGTLRDAPNSEDIFQPAINIDLMSTGKNLRAELLHFQVPKTRTGNVFGHSRLVFEIENIRQAIDPINGTKFFRFDLTECH
ncbi:MAG: hypothetical protein NT027_14595 [Proteobacteria bacterium]|nr:hypothetical protein [Pseudomonadota bacterium]